jgi:class 3 adenylate cyclase/tetratricopeptide (TPR) repeat protein
MTFEEVLEQAIAMLQRRGRLTYRTLKRQFRLDDEALDDLKMELIKGQRLGIDEGGEVLVWTGAPAATAEPLPAPQAAAPMASGAAGLTPDPLSYTPPHLAQKILTSRSVLEGERKQVTVLFCDLANSTSIAENIGPEPMHTLLNSFFTLALDAVHRYEGTINQFLGDGFMALFGAPIAHEDHARRAVLAALDLQRTLHSHHPELGEPYGVTCAYRMGLNSGLVVVGSIGDNLRMDYSAVGDTTNLAARLQQAAEPGSILISDNTRRLVQGEVRLQAMPPVQVKGKTTPITPYAVVGTLPRRTPLAARGERTLSPCVGRARELAVLDDLFAQVEAGQGQVVGIVAEAGSGKSRLLYEFRQRLYGKRVTYLEGRCVSYGSTMPYQPLIDVVRQNCGITETDRAEAIIDKVRAALQEVGMDPETSAAYLLRLLGVKEGTEAIAVLTPEAVQSRIFATLTQMSLHGSQRRPLVFAIEDVHWIDNTSAAYLASLVENLAGAVILLLTTYRPGYRPPWLDTSYATQISLGLLGSKDAASVVRSNSQHRALPDHLVQAIVAKADGNPFFLEELTRTLLEQEALQHDMTVPDTIQGVLMARIDRLPEDAKRLVQTAAVLGREFSLRLLQATWDGSQPLSPLLMELQRREFLYARTGTDEPVYVFRHALTQEVAYISLLTPRRQALHAAAGRALEALYADRLEEVYDRLAYHYAQTEEAAKAVDYLTHFAAQSAASYAHEEAITALQEARRHAERLPGQERDRRVLDLVMRQEQPLHDLGRNQEALDLLLPQQEYVERLQEPVQAANYYLHLASIYNGLGDWQAALQSAQRCFEAASQCGHVAALGRAHYLLMFVLNYIGQPRQALVHGQQAVPLLEGVGEWYWLGHVHYWFAFIALRLGDFDHALQSAARTASLGETIGDRNLQCRAAMMAQLTYVTKGEWDAAITWGERALDLATGLQQRAWIWAAMGYAHLEQGDTAKAIALLEQSVQHFRRVQQIWGWFAAWLGEAYAAAGRIAEARDMVLQGVDRTRQAEYWIGIGIAQRALGRVDRASGALSEAETHLQEALQTFTSHGFRPDVARTHLDLATVAHAQGNAVATATHLRQAHMLFTTLQAPAYVERTEQLARDYGMRLTNATPEAPAQDKA